ncbi:hypothetical protein AFK68_12235 [Hydrocoleum sp. CS-953]|uniref:hypothetical protein n=1 Tax=Hydrocoleum sp. CS-953 TaxID=1671698 RepID=UPI000B9AA61C|nr:hypothetical protein [Hydrocoleum sp. CS-953]OZH54230.1 hypothetical protein AFK68_12235 [Hydrocoleum sp. CS-953]
MTEILNSRGDIRSGGFINTRASMNFSTNNPPLLLLHLGVHEGGFTQSYSAFQMDKPHRHNQNFVGTFHGTSLLWSTQMKTAVG